MFPKSLPVARTSDYSEPALTALPEKEPEQSAHPTAQANRTALRNLWRHIELSENKGKPVSFHDLLASSVFVYGTAGGVGATTISATLARLFAKAGANCALLDDRNESVLPFFFGEQRAVYDGQPYAGLHAASDIAVRIITRQTSDTGAAQDEASNESDWLQRSVSSLQNHLQHLVIDIQRGQEPSLPPNAAPVALLAAVPDVSSLVGARALKRILSEKASGSQVICVLNKFDSSLALHVEIHGWFQENFSRVLTLGRSDLLNEALAEGLTIVDWMPQSTAAAEFLNLLSTIQSIMSASSHAQKKGGLSPCS